MSETQPAAESGETAQPAPAPAVAPQNGIAIAALCVGAASALLGLVGPVAYGAFYIGGGVIGLILTAAYASRVKRGTAPTSGMHVIGGLLALVAIVLGIYGIVEMQAIVDNARDAYYRGIWR